MRTNFCTICNSQIIEHADGSLYCSCDSLEIDPLGEMPDGWELNEETMARVFGPTERRRLRALAAWLRAAAER